MLSGRSAAATHARRITGDAGSSLMLMPAAVLIVLLLGAVAVDLSIVRMAHRDLVNVAASAANDAVTDGLDAAEYRRSGAYVIDLDRANEVLDRSLAHHGLADRITGRSMALGPGPDELTVELEMEVSAVFARSLPHAASTSTVRARASASVQRR